MKIAIGSDHRGYSHKEYIKKSCSEIEWIDVGADNDERSDYPIFAHKVVDLIQDGVVQYGILLCGTGIGMAIAANRFRNIYAGVVWNSDVAQRSKTDDNCNILVFPADYVSQEESVKMIRAWLQSEFLAGRYAHRIAMIDQ